MSVGQAIGSLGLAGQSICPQHPYVLSTSTGTHYRQRLHLPEGEESPFFLPGLTWRTNSEPEEMQIQPATFQFSFIKLHGPPRAN